MRSYGGEEEEAKGLKGTGPMSVALVREEEGGVLNIVLGNHYRVDYLKAIRAET